MILSNTTNTLTEEDLSPLFTGHMFNLRFVQRQTGGLLTRLDSQNRILGFFGGWLRTEIDSEHDSVLLIGLDDIWAAKDRWACQAVDPATANQHQGVIEPHEIILEGEDKKRQFQLKMHHSVDVEKWLDDAILPEGEKAYWGVFEAGKGRDKTWDRDKFLGEVAEKWLDPNRKWREAPGLIPGSGTSCIQQRLSPEALDIAYTIPSAWQFARLVCLMFGGIEDFPVLERLKHSSMVLQALNRENKFRQQRKVYLEQRRLERLYEQRPNSSLSPEQAAMLAEVDQRFN